MSKNKTITVNFNLNVLLMSVEICSHSQCLLSGLTLWVQS